jgi:heme exporter protein C
MGVCGLMTLVWRMKMAEILLRAIAPFGTLLAAISLVTGALWGRPTWGTYWVWDARLTSMLILLFLYLGVQALHAAISDPRQAARASGLLAIVGVINVVIVKYSVDWWFSLHQGSTLKLVGKTTMPWDMLTPLLLSIAGVYLWFAVAVLIRARTEILWRERRSNWVRELLEVKP